MSTWHCICDRTDKIVVKQESILYEGHILNLLIVTSLYLKVPCFKVNCSFPHKCSTKQCYSAKDKNLLSVFTCIIECRHAALNVCLVSGL